MPANDTASETGLVSAGVGARLAQPHCFAWAVRVLPVSSSARLAEMAFAVPYRGDDGGVFMSAHRVGALVSRRRLAERWSNFTVALVDGSRCLARGVAVPYDARVPGRAEFPDGGWEQVVLWAVEDALDGRAPDTVCALEIAVHPDVQGQGLSALVLNGLRANAGDLGFTRLVAPVRPPRKADHPWMLMADYAAWLRGDGLPQDPWLRVHVRAGGQMTGVAKCSTTIAEPLSRWRQWTGMALDADGLIAIPGGLAPLLVATNLDVGCYVEPNVWFEHSV